MASQERASLEIYVLGMSRLYVDGVPVEEGVWRSKKALLLFFYLLAARGKKVSRDVLLEVLWPEEDAEVASGRLHTAIHTVRRTIQPHLQAPRESDYIQYSLGLYWFDASSCWLDVEEFEQLIREGNTLAQKDPFTALDRYQKALALYQGDFLAELAYKDWAIAERERLRESFITLSIHTARLLTDLEIDIPEAVRILRRALATDPYREELHHALMSHLIKAGHHAEAARQYQLLVKMLDEEFGLPPSPDTQALFSTMKSSKSSAADDLLPDFDKEAPGPFVCDRRVLEAIHELALRSQRRYDAPSSILTITPRYGKPQPEQMIQLFRYLQTTLRESDVLCQDGDSILIQLPHTGRIPCEIVKRRIERGLIRCNLSSMMVTAQVYENAESLATLSP